ncbi:MAG TPA: hypothetical protein VFV73_39765 [Streptosporangiaceae bacterium]|nr:hypothetical protein [Streptosporangiaceae bacterium]
MISSGVLGGGFGRREWVLNAQVPAGYARTDPARHLTELAGGRSTSSSRSPSRSPTRPGRPRQTSPGRGRPGARSAPWRRRWPPRSTSPR